MVDAFVATKKTTRYGNSVYVCIDADWGIKPGEMVRITVERCQCQEPQKED